MSIIAGFCLFGDCLFLQGVLQNLRYFLALAYHILSNMDSLKGSDFVVLLVPLSEQAAGNCPNSSEIMLLYAQLEAL